MYASIHIQGDRPISRVPASFAPQRISRWAVCALFSLMAASSDGHGPYPAPPLPDPHHFALMAWDDAPATASELRDMRAAGLNIAGFCREKDLPKIRAAGLACFLKPEALDQVDWQAPQRPAGLNSVLKHAADVTRRHPEVLGVFLSDEPQTADLPALRAAAELLETGPSPVTPYINLFPFRSHPVDWYTNYADYAQAVTAATQPRWLSFDNYSLSYAGLGDEYFTNLEFVRRAALENHLPFWACIQAVAHFGYREPTDATLRVQAYSALAYGATGIEYFTYFTPERGNYRLGAIDPFGHRTATWDTLRRVNQELKALAPVITGLVSTGVYHYPDVPREGQALSDSRLIQRIDMTKDEDDFVPPAVEPRYLVGEFRDGHGRPYLLLVNKDLEHSFKFEITFRVPPEKTLRINPNSGREEPFGFEQNWLAPGGGVLLRLH